MCFNLGTQEEAETAESGVQGYPGLTKQAEKAEKKPIYVFWDNIMEAHCSN